MNNNTNEIDPTIPGSDNGQNDDPKDTIGWVLAVLLKFGAGYLTKMILDALFH